MDELLGNIASRTTGGKVQWIFPDVSFTCSGSVKSWVFLELNLVEETFSLSYRIETYWR